MTAENFNEIVKDGARSTGYGGAVYIIFMMMVGQYVFARACMCLCVRVCVSACVRVCAPQQLKWNVIV